MKNKNSNKPFIATKKKSVAGKSKASPKKASQDEVHYTVHGLVHQLDGSPFANLLVRAVDKDMYGEENLLGETRTNKKD